jgi:hypothetical protein
MAGLHELQIQPYIEELVGTEAGNVVRFELIRQEILPADIKVALEWGDPPAERPLRNECPAGTVGDAHSLHGTPVSLRCCTVLASVRCQPPKLFDDVPTRILNRSVRLPNLKEHGTCVVDAAPGWGRIRTANAPARSKPARRREARVVTRRAIDQIRHAQFP